MKPLCVVTGGEERDTIRETSSLPSSLDLNGHHHPLLIIRNGVCTDIMAPVPALSSDILDPDFSFSILYAGIEIANGSRPLCPRRTLTGSPWFLQRFRTFEQPQLD
jgi:hypothetical protein